MIFTGTMLAYYSVCHRKLWLFLHNLEQEHNSDDVLEGLFISAFSYNRNKKEILYGGISIDFIDTQKKILHEIKKTNKLEYAHILQVQYYLYVLEESGVTGFKGLIDYPKLRRRVAVHLDDNIRSNIASIKKEILQLASSVFPPDPINKPYCKKCAYYELCYI